MPNLVSRRTRMPGVGPARPGGGSAAVVHAGQLPASSVRIELEHHALALATLVNHRNTQYIGTVGVGTPPQRFRLLFDTGSANTWLYAADCWSWACRSHRLYDRLASASWRGLNRTISIEYGSGNVSGRLATDTFSLGGELHVPGVPFGEMVSGAGAAFAAGRFDGVVGLAFAQLSVAPSIPPLLDELWARRRSRRVFAFYLTKAPAQRGSSLTLGGVDPSRMAEPTFTFHPVVKQAYWEIALRDVRVGGRSLGLCPRGCRVAVDSGTSLVTGPQARAEIAPRSDPATPRAATGLIHHAGGDWRADVAHPRG